MTTDKAWKRAANRVLGKSGLRLASSNEAGWYYRVTVNFEGETETTQVWVTEK